MKTNPGALDQFFFDAHDTLKIHTTRNLDSSQMNEIFDFLESRKDITTLEFYNCRMQPEAVDEMAIRLSKNSTLKYLKIESTAAAKTGMKNLAIGIGNNRNLEFLKISSCALDDESAAFLANALEKNQSITTLDLRANQIGNNGLLLLAEKMQKKPNLNINLYSNIITLNGTTPVMNMLPGAIGEGRLDIMAQGTVLRAQKSMEELRAIELDFDSFERTPLKIHTKTKPAKTPSTIGMIWKWLAERFQTNPKVGIAPPEEKNTSVSEELEKNVESLPTHAKEPSERKSTVQKNLNLKKVSPFTATQVSGKNNQNSRNN